MTLIVLAAAIAGYLMGSVPYGLLLARAAGLGDVRAIGSGNIGATNVLRTGSKAIAAATLLADALKGTLPVIIAAQWSEPAAIAAAIGAFLGHLFPVWLSFKGGKGVATFLGITLGFSPALFLVFAASWLAIAFAFRISSLAALVAVGLTIVCAFVLSTPGIAAATSLLGIMVIARHRENISRLLRGEESRISFTKKG